MFTTFVTIFTVIALALGGTTATVYAAQGSLPGEALYQLKLQSEDLRLTWEHQEMEKIALALQFANRRMEEAQAMLSENQAPPESLLLRLQTHLDAAFRFAAGLDDEQVMPALQQIRQTLENQERILAQLQENAGPPETAVLLRIRDQVRLRLSWVEEVQADPAQLRLRFGPGAPEGMPPSLTHTPVDGFGPGPFITGTPTPGTGYGPGPGPQATCTCTPQSGIGPQPTSKPGEGIGPGPQPTEAPKDGTGPGPQPTEAPKDGTGPGPQPTAQPPQDPGNQPNNPGNNPGSGGKP